MYATMFRILIGILLVSSGFSVENQKRLLWRSNHAGLFSHFLQLKMMYEYSKSFDRILVVEPITSNHYGSQAINLCDFFDLSATTVTCSKMPDGMNCVKQMTNAFMKSDDPDICYGGQFMFQANGGKNIRDGIIRAIPVQLPLRFVANNLQSLNDFKTDMGITTNTKYTVAHWRRGDQLGNARCGNGVDSSVNCKSAEEFIAQVRRYTNDSIVYIATNELQNSKHMHVIRNAGFLTFSNVGKLHDNKQSDFKYQHLDMLSVLAIEVSLMLEASTFLAWGISEIDDVVEYERQQASRSYCVAHEHFVVKNGNVTYCLLESMKKEKHRTDIITTMAVQTHIQNSQPSPTLSMSASKQVNNTDTLTTRQLNSSRGTMLIKSVFSNRTRLLFVAGLEGTGHHAIQAMIKVCNRTKLCESQAAISQALMRYDFKLGLNHGLFGAKDADSVDKDVNAIETAMQSMLKVGGDHLYFVGLGFVPGTGMLSYPNFNGKHKSLDHPEVHALAAIAERMGVDFRVLVLNRDASAIIESTSKRGFGGILGTAGEPKILIDNAAVLYTQLVMLDKAFFHCVHYDKLGNMTERQRVEMAEFLHPVNMKSELEVMLKEISYSHSSSVHVNNTRILTSTDQNISTNAMNENVNISTIVKSFITKKFKVQHTSNSSKASIEYHTRLLSDRLSLIDSLC